MGQFSGMGSLAVLLRSPIALTSVLVGALLLALGSYWSARMIRAARAQEVDHGIYFDAISIALNSGLAIDHAKALAGEANPSVADDLKEMIELSKTTGAALGKLLIDKADEIRAEVSYNKALVLEKLSVKLMVPLGVSVLPAFALIAVVPLAMSFLVNQNGG
jgi:tight adherence protein B